MWLLELLCAISSLACTAAMFSFLCAIDGKPYSQWHVAHVEITPNTMLSIISTFAKASLLMPVTEGISQLKWVFFQQRERSLIHLQVFDEASRGPVGSLRLLWCINFRAPTASLGAVIMVLALITDPFTNQVLTINTMATAATNESASIGASRAFGLQSGGMSTYARNELCSWMLEPY